MKGAEARDGSLSPKELLLTPKEKKVKARVLKFLRGVDLGIEGEVQKDVRTITTRIDNYPDGSKAISHLALVNGIRVAQHQDVIEDGQIIQAIYMLFGEKRMTHEPVSIGFFEVNRSERNSSRLTMTGDGRKDVPISSISKKDQRNTLAIFGI